MTADDTSFDSGLFGSGKTFSHTFTIPGTYPYYCIPHGAPGRTGMAGTVVVSAGPARPAPAAATAAPSAAAQPARAGLPLAEAGSLLLASGVVAGAAGFALRRRR